MSGDLGGARRRGRVVVVCLALVTLFGSGAWRLTSDARDGVRNGAQDRLKGTAGGIGPSALRSAGIPGVGSPLPRYDRLATVDWDTVRYPVRCPPGGVHVVATEFADVDGDAVAEATVLVRCAAGGEHQPTGLYVYAGPEAQAGRGRPPRLLATLLEPAAGVAATHVRVSAARIKAGGFGYSSPAVPRCCPDETVEASWRWNGSGFTRVG